MKTIMLIIVLYCLVMGITIHPNGMFTFDFFLVARILTGVSLGIIMGISIGSSPYANESLAQRRARKLREKEQITL